MENDINITRILNVTSSLYISMWVCSWVHAHTISRIVRVFTSNGFEW